MTLEETRRSGFKSQCPHHDKKVKKMLRIDKMLGVNIKNFNEWTVISILFILVGLFFWIYWILRYDVIYDIGIYSFVVVFILAGLIGLWISLMNKEED